MSDTKNRLLDSAEQLTRTRGYNGFSYADLASEVGIRKASIHHHYPTKLDLALALMKRYRAVFLGALMEIGETHSTAGEKLNAFMDVYKNALGGGDTLCLCVAFSLSRESLGSEVLAEVDSLHDATIAWLVTVFEQATQESSVKHVESAKQEGAACLALVEGAQLMARAASEAGRYETAVAVLRSRIVSVK